MRVSKRRLGAAPDGSNPAYARESGGMRAVRPGCGERERIVVGQPTSTNVFDYIEVVRSILVNRDASVMREKR